MALEPEAFQRRFRARISDGLATAASNPDRLVAIDGKACRGSRHPAKGLGAPHIVGARAGEEGIALGQVAADAKSDEITAIPQLPEQIDLAGTLITIDAMGCQKEIVGQIVTGGGACVVAVKGNQPRPTAAISRLIGNPSSPATSSRAGRPRHPPRGDGPDPGEVVLPAGRHLSGYEYPKSANRMTDRPQRPEAAPWTSRRAGRSPRGTRPCPRGRSSTPPISPVAWPWPPWSTWSPNPCRPSWPCWRSRSALASTPAASVRSPRHATGTGPGTRRGVGEAVPAGIRPVSGSSGTMPTRVIPDKPEAPHRVAACDAHAA
jgi:hypothetical protein